MILDYIRDKNKNVTPSSAAIIFRDKELTYKDLYRLTDKTSQYLARQGIKENDIITILSENSQDFIVIVLALWQIGAIPAPLNTKLLDKELNEQINFLRSEFTLRSKNFSSVNLNSKILTIPFDEPTSIGNNFVQNNFSGDKTALILFTSGSSGKPKAVMLSFNNLFQSALNGDKVLNHNADDKWLASLPFYHIGGFSIFFRAFLFGVPVIIPDSLSAGDLIKSIINSKPSLTSLVSSQLKNFGIKNFIPPEELRLVLLGGGFTDSKLILNAIDKGWRLAKVYGSTETSSFVSFMNTEEVLKKPQASGKAIHPNKILIAENNEILVDSPSVMRGYFNNEKETSSKLKNGFYYTGDIGYLDDEGYLYVEAKRSDLIISGGENVNPSEVESIILSHPAVKEVCVVGREDDKWGEVISAAVVLKENFRLDENELSDFLKDKIASFKIPKKIIFTNVLPKSELGKILQEKVKELF